MINDGDAPHDYFPSRPNGVWIEHHGPGNLSALVSGIELTTTEEDAGAANARGFNLTLYAGSADTSTTRRDLSLKVEKSIFNTYARALTGVHVGTGDVNIEATDLQITTTGPSGHGIVGWHDANGNVNVNVKRSNIVAEQGYGVSGFVWNSIKFNRIPDPGDKTLSLQVSDSQIRAQHGLYARHQGSGKIDLLLNNSSITTEAANHYGIFALHTVNSGNADAPDNLDISINVANSQVTTANAHGILVFRQFNPNSTGTDRITVGPNSKVEVGGAGASGIFTQSVSDITIEGQVTSEAGNAILVGSTASTGANTIKTGSNSRIEAGGSGTGILAQGKSDITVGGQITAEGGGHGVHVLRTESTGANTIKTGSNSRIETEGDGYAVKTQGRSIITIEGSISAKSKVAAHNTGGDFDVVLRGNPRVEDQQVWNQRQDDHNLDVEVNGEKLVDDGEVIRRAGPALGTAFDIAVRKIDDDPDFDIIEFSRGYGPRASVYESLPETLHMLNRLSTRQERGGAATSPDFPFWMQAEGSRATREPTDSTTGADWQMERWALHAGYRVPVTEDIEAGLSLHYGDSSTDVSAMAELGGGEIDTESYGLGASLTWHLENGIYLDAQGAANWYDSDLSVTDRGTLKSGVDGTGWALALEIGRRVEMTELTVTPHARVVYSEVDPDSFVDKFGGRVSSDSDDRTMGGLGVTFEGRRGWVLAEFQREFGTGTSVDVTGTSLKQRMARARARIATGGSASVLGDKLTLRGELGAASDISSSAEDTEVKAGITAHMSF